MNSSLVQKSSVAAAEVDQPKFPDILQMDQRVPAGHVGRFQHDRVNGGPSDRTTTLDRMARAIGCFQPGTFLLGRIHHSDSTKVVNTGKACQIKATLRGEIGKGVNGGLSSFCFLPTSKMCNYFK